jgi:hypothetical protein
LTFQTKGLLLGSTFTINGSGKIEPAGHGDVQARLFPDINTKQGSWVMVIDEARQVLQIEADGIVKLIDRLDHRFDQYGCKSS